MKTKRAAPPGRKTINKILRAAGVAVFWIGLWFAASFAVGKELLLPSPAKTLSRLCELAVTSDFWMITSYSLLRVMAGIAAAVLLGVVFALPAAFFRPVRDILSPALAVIKATPVASFIILALTWLDKNTLPTFTTILIVFPVIYANVVAGINSVDRQLCEVAKIYRFPFSKSVSLVYLPSVTPYFIAGCRTSIGLAWKAGIAAEVLCTPQNSIGKMLYESKLYLETPDLFAWTLTVIILSLIIEYVFMALIGRAGKRLAPVTNK